MEQKKFDEFDNWLCIDFGIADNVSKPTRSCSDCCWKGTKEMVVQEAKKLSER
jgi:hypothetical protein